MLIQKNTQRSFIKPKTTNAVAEADTGSQKSSNPALDGFTKGANITTDLMLYGTSALAGMGAASEYVFQGLMPGDEMAANVASFVVGGIVGLGVAYAADKGIDKASNAMSKNHGDKIAAGFKTAVAGAITGVESPELAAATVGIIATGGVLGGGVGLIADKVKK